MGQCGLSICRRLGRVAGITTMQLDAAATLGQQGSRQTSQCQEGKAKVSDPHGEESIHPSVFFKSACFVVIETTKKRRKECESPKRTTRNHVKTYMPSSNAFIRDNVRTFLSRRNVTRYKCSRANNQIVNKVGTGPSRRYHR